MPYNTSRGKLIMREYGRHVQEMVEYVAQIEDPKMRNERIQMIIELMGTINPHLRNVDDFRHKLYDHIYIMADYNIDIESPYPKPEREIIERKPDPLPYPHHKLSFKHYGKNIERMMEKAKTFEEKEKQQLYLQYLANYMKLVHNNWNKENVSDEVIREDLKVLSKGELELAPDADIQQYRVNNRNQRENDRPRHGGKGKNFRGPKHNSGGRSNNQNRNFKRK
jgi:hypothetical protein